MPQRTSRVLTGKERWVWTPGTEESKWSSESQVSSAELMWLEGAGRQRAQPFHSHVDPTVSLAWGLLIFNSPFSMLYFENFQTYKS